MVSEDVERPMTKLERARSAGTLPTASSLYSFTDPPNPGHNKAPCFSLVSDARAANFD